MFHNDIKWQKFQKLSENNENPQKFIECLKNLLTESKFDEKYDEILYKIDSLLLEMTESEQSEAEKMLEATLNEIEPYQKIMKKEHPKWKFRLIGHGKNKDKSSPYKFKPSMKRNKSAPPSG